ncbi:MAG: apolipoprotein N-acyltransferase [Fidelibacterota bacterium]|jgi:apolipoprotein N-acyltransferase|tara:strand:+ start:9216 stop:10721 length:1506 start_codon:yes stop_codon:yes gene_type:complete
MFFSINFLNLSLTILSGLLVGISYQPWGLGFLSFIGFVPLIRVWLISTSKKNLLYGYIFGFTYNLTSNYWIGSNSGAEPIVVISSLIFATLYLALFWSLPGYIIGLLNKNSQVVYSLPFLIVILEWIRSFGPLGFSWGNLALTQVEYLPLLQFNDIFGPYFSTFIILSVNIAFYFVLFDISKRLFVLAAIVVFFIVFLFIGSLRINSFLPTDEFMNVSIIQPNLDPNKKWDYSTRIQTFNIMDSLYNEALNLSPDIILFPETALPTYLTLDKKIRRKFQDKVDKSKIPILIGTVDRSIDSTGEKVFYNSAMFMSPNTKYEIYAKMHLVPFAEYDLVPKILHPLIKLNLNIDRGTFKGGKIYKTFEWKNIIFSDLICYESSLPRYAREFSKRGAKILMIQANDGWLGMSSGPYQHFSLAILRAIENRLPIVRSGNTGISGIILPSGKVQIKKELNTQAVFMGKVPIYSKKSFYSQYGDFFAVISFVTFMFIGPIKCSKKEYL